MSTRTFVAVDLGAESGRVVAGVLEGDRIALHEHHRFANRPVRLSDGIHWDILRIHAEMLHGLGAAARAHGRDLAGIGVDSWGVDFGLLDDAGRLLGNPYSYRDARTDAMPAEADRLVPAAERYARTGIAALSFNTIFQLMALGRSGDRSMDLAASLLMVPDLLHFWLCGERATEYTNAGTSGALGVDRVWARDLLARLGAPHHMLLEPVSPGTRLGTLRQTVQEECGLANVPIIAPATHDTASAVAAVPADPAAGPHAFLSCGTWSLLGLESPRPILSEEARLAGFTNEGGVGGFRFLTNISGLWLVQECRRSWARAGMALDYETLTAQAAVEPSPGVVIDVDDPAFLHPDDMVAAITTQLTRRGSAPPSRPPALTRAILESLARRYAAALSEAEALSGTRVSVLHMVGGGSRNHLLCRLTADACGRPVIAGPAEATALGNILVQAMGAGLVANLSEARAIARASTATVTYEPA